MYDQQTCSVCDLCYKLLVTEQELLEVRINFNIINIIKFIILI